jgi:hypothetical protein
MESFLMEWSAPEYEHRPKTSLWYWGSILIAVLILGMAVWQKNFLFAAFVVLAEILILTWGERPPRLLSFTLTEKGLTVNENKFYPLGNFKSFSLDHESHEEWAGIVLFFESHLRPSILVHAPHAEAEEIAAALRYKLKEVPWEPTLLDSLERFFKF